MEWVLGEGTSPTPKMKMIFCIWLATGLLMAGEGSNVISVPQALVGGVSVSAVVSVVLIFLRHMKDTNIVVQNMAKECHLRQKESQDDFQDMLKHHMEQSSVEHRDTIAALESIRDRLPPPPPIITP